MKHSLGLESTRATIHYERPWRITRRGRFVSPHVARHATRISSATAVFDVFTANQQT